MTWRISIGNTIRNNKQATSGNPHVLQYKQTALSGNHVPMVAFYMEVQVWYFLQRKYNRKNAVAGFKVLPTVFLERM